MARAAITLVLFFAAASCADRTEKQEWNGIATQSDHGIWFTADGGETGAVEKLCSSEGKLPSRLPVGRNQREPLVWVQSETLLNSWTPPSGGKVSGLLCLLSCPRRTSSRSPSPAISPGTKHPWTTRTGLFTTFGRTWPS